MRRIVALLAVLAAVASAPPALGQEVASPKIHPRIVERAQSEAAVIPVFIVLVNQPQREILERAESANALYRQVAESHYQQVPGAETRVAAEGVLLRTRRQAFQAIEQAVGPEQEALESRLRGLGAARISRYLGINMLTAEIPASAIAALEADPSIARLFPVEKLYPQLATSVPALGAPAFWSAGYTGQGESVGILDSGVRTNHPAFAGVSIVSQIFLANGGTDPCFADSASSAQDQVGHGTHVAGIVASQGSAGWTNYKGVAKGIGTLYNLKVAYEMRVSSSCDPVGAESDPRDVFAALDWAVANTPLKIFNYSYGGQTSYYDEFSQAIDQYIDGYGLVFTISAGNGGQSYGVTSPAYGYNGIAVGNWVTRGVMNTSSSAGGTNRCKPDLAAPGTNIYSAAYDWDSQSGTSNDFVAHTGTSMAAPHIAGAAALLANAGVTDPMVVRALLINTADGPGGCQGPPGWGYTNLDTALNQLNYVTGTLGLSELRLYKVAASSAARSTLTWNRHASEPASTSINMLSLRLFRADTGEEILVYYGYGGDQNVIQASGTYSGEVVLSLQAWSAWVGVTSEPFAMAFSAPAVPVSGPRIVASCNLPSSIASGSQFTVTCGVTNSGDLPVPAGQVQVTLPAGFTAGPQTTLGAVAPGTTANSYLTATAPAMAGTYTVHWTVTTPSAFAFPAFTSTSSAMTAVQLALPAPALVSPANGAVGVPLPPTVAWTPSAGASTYDVYFGASWPPTLVATTAGASYAPDGLSPGTQYYWQVVARSGAGASASATWSFTTQAPSGQPDQIIVTVAGGGSGPGWVDGAPATSAVLNMPSHIAVDAAGNLYIAEAALRKVTPDGIITTVAQLPSGVLAADAAGNLYVGSTFSVLRIGSDHTLSTVAGTGTQGYSGDGGLATSAQLSGAGGLAPSAHGDLYIADTSNCVVRKVSANAIITTVAGNGACGYSGDGGPARSAQLFFPEGLALDASGALYIADTRNQRIRKVTPNGVITTLAGNGAAGYSGDGGPATAAELNWPGGLALDGGGNLYIADSANYRVRKLAPDGTITTAAGNGSYAFSGEAGPPLSAGMNAADVAVDKSGSLYIDDIYAARVRELVPANSPSCQFQVDPSVIAVPGTGGAFPVSVQTGPACWWAASGLPYWITGPSSGKGPSTVNLSVAASTNFLRTATISVAGAAVTITQADGSCSLAVSPTSVVVPAAGGAVEVGVTFCSPWTWFVSSPPDWVTVGGTGSGTGNGTVRFTVGPNTGPARYGTLLIGQAGFQQVTFPIMQLAAAVNGLRFVPVAPCRIADTRWGAGPFGGPSLAAASLRSFVIPQSACGTPATAQAYSLNVTAVPQGPLYYLSVLPTGQDQPQVSTLNSWGGIVAANAAIVPAGLDGAVSVYASNPTNVILDINGYFDSPGSYAFYPVQPCRIADTRGAAGPFGGPSLAGGQTRDFPVPSSPCGVPSNASAYSMNVTVVPDGYLGFLSTWPTGQAQPNVSTLNSWTGKVVANAALVPAGNSGSVSVFALDATDVILDTNGYFGTPGNAGALNFYPVTPCRVADTRWPSGPFGGPELAAATPRSFPIPTSGCGIPTTAAAYSLNVTVVPDGLLQFLTAWPTGAALPVASTLNSWDGAVVANAAILPAGAGGAISVYASDPTHVILDINGYFAQ